MSERIFSWMEAASNCGATEEVQRVLWERRYHSLSTWQLYTSHKILSIRKENHWVPTTDLPVDQSYGFEADVRSRLQGQKAQIFQRVKAHDARLLAQFSADWRW